MMIKSLKCVFRAVGRNPIRISRNFGSFCVNNKPPSAVLPTIFTKIHRCLQSTRAIGNFQDQTRDRIKAESDEMDEEKKRKIIELEIEVLKQEGGLVPDNIADKEWVELLLLPSRMKRVKYLTFLFKNERHAENVIKKKEAKRAALQAALAEANAADDGHIKYGLSKNTIFFRIYDTTMDNQLNNKLIQAMQFSQDIVIDCSYDEHMTRRELANCAKQLCFMFAENRIHADPFNIQFCNVNESGFMMRKFSGYIPTWKDAHYPINLNRKSYLEMYPKERLVYLTPHCVETLREYNHDDVYIIGAMVDKVNQDHVSMAKAKEQGLRMAKLPLDQYLAWGMGNKSLTLGAVMNIMLDMRRYNDWNIALKHVPRRKLFNEKTDLHNPNFQKIQKKLVGPFARNRLSMESLFKK